MVRPPKPSRETLAVLALLGWSLFALTLMLRFATFDRWVVQGALRTAPGMSMSEVVGVRGAPQEVLTAGQDDLVAYCRMGSHIPHPPDVPWVTAYGYRQAWYLQIVLFDADGKVICVHTAGT